MIEMVSALLFPLSPVVDSQVKELLDLSDQDVVFQSSPPTLRPSLK